jgi:hypothetical protein
MTSLLTSEPEFDFATLTFQSPERSPLAAKRECSQGGKRECGGPPST